MKIFSAICILTFAASSAVCQQQDSVILNLFTDKVDKKLLKYVLKLEFVSNKKNDISFQYKPKYIIPNEIDGIGIEIERLVENCYQKQSHSDVHPVTGVDVLEDNVKTMSFGDTSTISLDIGANISTFMGRVNDLPTHIFRGQHRIRAYRVYFDDRDAKTKFSNWLYINFDESD